MWGSEVTEKSSSSCPCPCPCPPSSSSSWSMMNIMGHHHHHHHEHDPHHDHHVKQGSIAPCHVSQPLVPHLNNYKLIKALGNGSMGTVFLGLFLDNPPPSSDVTKDEDKAFNEEGHTSSSLHVKPHVSSHDLGLFALKVMSKEEMWRKGMVKRASMEREVLMACSDATRTGIGSGGRRSPFLPSLKAHFESETHQVLVMDYCCGGDLNHLRSCKAKEGSNGSNKFSEEDARFYGAEIILALEKLHELGFVYRDLKPENVMVRGDGHIMLADFDLCLKLPSQPPTPTQARTLSGKIRSLRKLKRWVGDRMASSLASCVNASESARVSGSSSSTTRVTPVLQAAANAGSRTGRSLSFVGTEEYVAPEILWGTGHDLAVDWWTLGILLFDLVAGTTPFKSLTRKETFFNILCKEPKLDTCLPTASPQFLDLVSRLLCKQPSDRLGFAGGAHEIKSHPFFHGVNWDSHHEIPNSPYTPSPHILALDSLEDNDTLLESQLTIAEHRRKLAHASANEHVHTHHHDFRVF